MRLRAVIVNWNGGNQIICAIQALQASELPAGYTLEVVVVDNGSTDESLAWLRRESASHILQLVELGINRGFAYACNAGAKGFEGEYLLFLNPDTRVHPDAIQQALAAFEGDEKSELGIVGISSLGENGEVQRTSTLFPGPRNFINDALGLSAMSRKAFPGLLQDIYNPCESGIVDHVIGAFYLTRNRLFHDLGGFDERFFVYLEDLDYSWRAKQLGKSSLYLANASMYHKGGGISENVKDVRLFYALRSRILYSFKHFSPLSAWVVMLSTLLIEPMPRLFRAILHQSATEASYTVKAYLMLYRDLPNILSKR